MNIILRNLLDGHHLRLNCGTVASLNEGVAHGNHLLSTLVLGPSCLSVIDEVTIGKVIVCNTAINQAVHTALILHIQVNTILIDGGQRLGEVTHLTTAQAIEVLNAGNINLGDFHIHLKGQNLIVVVLTYNSIDVIGLRQVSGEGAVEGVIVIGHFIAIGIPEDALLGIDINLLQQYIPCPSVVTYLSQADFLGQSMELVLGQVP